MDRAERTAVAMMDFFIRDCSKKLNKLVLKHGDARAMPNHRRSIRKSNDAFARIQ
jgi:hypothetical protein